jgi:archaellum component FlaF (FlaF/FlaG flagellin family)
MSKGIKFNITQNGIAVQDVESQAILYNGILIISNDGQCRLRVDQAEYDLWQFRLLALHDLFFVNQEIVR